MIVPAVELIVQTPSADHSNIVAVKHCLSDEVGIKLFVRCVEIEDFVESNLFNPAFDSSFKVTPFEQGKEE